MNDIDWDFWRNMPNVMLWQACALSLNLNPDSLKRSGQGWMAGVGSGPYFDSRSFPNSGIEKSLHKRRELLRANITSQAHFSPGRIDMNTPDNWSVKLIEFVAWATSIEWDMPIELAVMAKPKALEPVPPKGEKLLNEKSEPAHLNIIGALLGLLLDGKDDDDKPYSSIKSQNDLIDILLDQHVNVPGITLDNLKKKFAAARRSVSSL